MNRVITMNSRMLVTSVLAVVLTHDASAECPPAPERQGCSDSESLQDRASGNDVIDSIAADESRTRSDFALPPMGDWTTPSGGRQDITKHRSTDHDDDSSTPDRAANVLWATDIARHVRNDAELAELLDRQLAAIARNGYGDEALVLSLAYREGSGALFNTSSATHDSQAAGGLDNLGRYLDEASRLVACSDMNWEDAGASRNEAGASRPANVPGNETLLAYDVWTQLAHQRYVQMLNEYGFDQALIGERAERVAVSVAFANPVIHPRSAYRGNGRTAPSSSGFSIRTLISYMRKRMDEGLASSFNDLVHDPLLRTLHRQRAAITAAASAEMLDRSLLAPNGGAPCPQRDASPISDAGEDIEETVEDPELDNNAPKNSSLMVSSSYGDPHLVSCDGSRFDFQAAGEFTAFRSNDGDIEIQVRQETVEALNASKNTAVAALVNGDRVGIYSDASGTRTLINGVEQPRGDFAIPLRDGATINSSAGYVVLRWGDGSELYVYPGIDLIDVSIGLSQNRWGEILGLYGTCDGRSDNDLTSRDGRVLTLPTDSNEDYLDVVYRQFGDSWRIGQEQSLFDYPAGKSTESFQLLNFPRAAVTLDDVAKEEQKIARRICLQKGAVISPHLENCILDIGLTGNHHFGNSSGRAVRNEGYVSHTTIIESDGFTEIEEIEVHERKMLFFQLKGTSGSLNLSAWELIAPSGEAVFYNCVYRCNQPGAVALNETGTYISRIKANTGERGAVTTVRHTIPSPQVFSISLPASIGSNTPAAGAGIIDVPGAVDQYVFSGRAGTKLSLHVTHRDSRLYYGTWSVVAPDGEVIFESVLPGEGFEPTIIELTDNGDFRLTLDGGRSWPSEDDYGYGRYQIDLDMPQP